MFWLRASGVVILQGSAREQPGWGALKRDRPIAKPALENRC